MPFLSLSPFIFSPTWFCSSSFVLSRFDKVVDFWFGTDLARLASDKEYGQSFGAKWFGAGPPDQAFIGTQNASKELMAKAGRYSVYYTLSTRAEEG